MLVEASPVGGGLVVEAVACMPVPAAVGTGRAAGEALLCEGECDASFRRSCMTAYSGSTW